MSLQEQSPAPWVPDTPFFEDNREVIDELFAQVARDFPESGAADVLDPNSPTPSPEAMSWMWTRLMGRQHGSTEGWGGKVPITKDLEEPYIPLASQLHYGPYRFMDANPLPADAHVDTALVTGGDPYESVRRLLAAVGNDPQNSNVDQVVYLGGQRMRWDIAAERDSWSIQRAAWKAGAPGYETAIKHSPYLREEERKGKDAFVDETAIGRLCLEFAYGDIIDYDRDVEITMDPDAQERVHVVEGKEVVIPARTEAVYTYHTTDGRKLHVLNGAAVQRPQGVSRPNTASQAAEVARFIPLPDKGTFAIATSSPHIRAGVDAVISLLTVAPEKVGSSIIVTNTWEPKKELITALGEIPATHKADLRIRAKLAGQDPNSPELASL